MLQLEIILCLIKPLGIRKDAREFETIGATKKLHES
jgi:hypothetical protein